MGSPLYRPKPVTGVLTLDKYGQIRGLPLDSPCPAGFTLANRSCWETTALNRRIAEYESNKATSFGQTLLTVGSVFAAGVATIFSAGAASPALSTVAGAAKFAATSAVKIGASLATASATSPQAGRVDTMGLNVGALLGGVGQLLGGVSTIPALQGVGQVVGAFAPAFSQPQNFGPVYSPAPIYNPGPLATPTMSAGPVIGAAAGAVARMTAPILFQISSKLGRKVSLSHAISIIRRMGKMLLDPTAIALALGVGLGELATLITAHSSRKSRHMNPANGKALRRAARRIKGFHRMCGTIDLLKSRGRGSSRRSFSTKCGTCRKSPCRC